MKHRTLNMEHKAQIINYKTWNMKRERAERKCSMFHASCSMTKGFTLVETLVATAIFLLVSLAVYQAYASVFKVIFLTKTKTAALDLVAERVEIVRNMPYASVGIISGIPVGILPHVATYTRSGVTFQATTTVRNIDDPFDGVIGGTPNDLSPADYKLVEFEIGCSSCANYTPISVTTTVSPRSLETTSGNGALFVQVIDANGNPVSDATVNIIGLGTSTVAISDVTNTNGLLQVVDVPPGSFMYSVAVSKTGYSSSRTYTATTTNPDPTIPHSTVSTGVVTKLTFSIDRLGSININTVDERCEIVPSVPFSVKGSKLIGNSPEIFKYSQSFTTSLFGIKEIPNLEWDSYSLSLGGAYDIAGSLPLLPIVLAPGADQNVYIVAHPQVPKTLLVTVHDSLGLPISDATVTITKGGISNSLITNQGFVKQTDWSGGAGQTSFSDTTQFLSSDGQVDFTSVPGDITLKSVFGVYIASGSLISSWFDVGTASTTLYSILWQPAGQPSETGADSVKFQIESTNDIATTTPGFSGSDGTNGTYYTLLNNNINPINNNMRYVRYKLIFSTTDTAFTPSISDTSITFGSECVPFGQTYFSGLSSGTYTLDVSQTGYQIYSGTVEVTGDSQSADVTLIP